MMKYGVIGIIGCIVSIAFVWAFLRKGTADIENDLSSEDSITIDFLDDEIRVCFMDEVTTSMSYEKFENFIAMLTSANNRAKDYLAHDVGMRVYSSEVIPFVCFGDVVNFGDGTLADQSTYLMSLEDSEILVESSSIALEEILSNRKENR